MTTTKQTCADLVQGSWDSTRADLTAMYTPWDCDSEQLTNFLDGQGIECEWDEATRVMWCDAVISPGWRLRICL